MQCRSEIGMSVISPQVEGALLRKTTLLGAPAAARARSSPDGALRRPAVRKRSRAAAVGATETLQVFFVRRDALWTETGRWIGGQTILD